MNIKAYSRPGSLEITELVVSAEPLPVFAKINNVTSRRVTDEDGARSEIFG
jgi:hypothetical protein